MSEVKEAAKQGLFDSFYMASKELIQQLQKPLVRNKIKRKLQTAFDDAESKINEALIKLNKSREDFENYNINTILEQKAIITQCKSLQEQIKQEYQELFAKEMNVEQD
jgi:uncharacterized protein YbcC (UPF0753/DUF2309 family)